MIVDIELNEHDIRELVIKHLRERLGDVDFLVADVRIEVKSKQNYKAEWEEASFRAKLMKHVKHGV